MGPTGLLARKVTNFWGAGVGQEDAVLASGARARGGVGQDPGQVLYAQCDEHHPAHDRGPLP